MKDLFAKIMRKCHEECKGKIYRDYSDLIGKTIGVIFRSKHVPYSLDDVHDLRNDVFIALFDKECKRLKVYDSEKMPFPDWLKMIASQTTKGKIRKKGYLEFQSRKFRQDLEDIRGYDEEYAAEEIIDEMEKSQIVKETIENMSARDREVLIGTYYQWKSLGELSEEIGVSYNTVAKRVHDAKIRLKKQVEDLLNKK